MQAEIRPHVTQTRTVQKRTFIALTFHDTAGKTAIPGRCALGEKELLPIRVSKIITGIRLLCSALCCLERWERKGVWNWQCWALNCRHFRRLVHQQAYIQRWCSCCMHALQPKLWFCFETWRILIKFIFWFGGKKNKAIGVNMDGNKFHLHCSKGWRQRGGGGNILGERGQSLLTYYPHFARTTETPQENSLYPPGASSYLGIPRIQNTRANHYIACWNTSAVWNSFLVRYNLREMETCISARQC
jgi:hypothetical protein